MFFVIYYFLLYFTVLSVGSVTPFSPPIVTGKGEQEHNNECAGST